MPDNPSEPVKISFQQILVHIVSALIYAFIFFLGAVSQGGTLANKDVWIYSAVVGFAMFLTKFATYWNSIQAQVDGGAVIKMIQLI